MALTPAEFEVALEEKKKRNEEFIRAQVAPRVDFLEKMIDRQLAQGSSICILNDDEELTADELAEVIRRYKAVGWGKIHYIPQHELGPRFIFTKPKPKKVQEQ